MDLQGWHHMGTDFPLRVFGNRRRERKLTWSRATSPLQPAQCWAHSRGSNSPWRHQEPPGIRHPPPRVWWVDFPRETWEGSRSWEDLGLESQITSESARFQLLPPLQGGICCFRSSLRDTKVRHPVYLPLPYVDTKTHPFLLIFQMR